MVAAFDFCLHGTRRRGAVDRHRDARPRDGGARRPPAPGRRHRDRDGGRRRAADDARSTATGRVGAVAASGIPARARHRRDPRRRGPETVGVILGGHGITAWGATSDEAEANSLWIIEKAQAYIDTHGDGGAVRARSSPSDARCRRRNGGRRRRRSRRTCGASRRTTTAWSGTSTTAMPCSSSSRARSCSRSSALGTSCPDHFLRTKVQAARARPAGGGGASTSASRGCASCTSSTAPTTGAYYERYATPESPPMRGRRSGDRARAGCRDVLVRARQADGADRRRVLRERDQRDARRGVGVDVRADPRDARSSASSTGRSRRRSCSGCRRAEAPRRARSRSSPAGRAASDGRSRTARGRGRVRRDRRPRRRRRRARRRPRSAARDVAIGVTADVTDAAQVRAAIDATLLAFGGIDLVVNNAGLSISKPLLETTERGLGRAARRDGEGQLPRVAGGGAGDDRAGAGRRHRVRRVEERGVRGSEQRRVQRGEGGPGAPGAAARGGAGRARHPRQRREPRRRRARERDLCRRVGGAAGRGVRGPRGGARRVLRRSARC